MIDSIASSYTHMRQAATQQAASVSVLKSSMKSMENQGRQLVELISSATPRQDGPLDPSLGNNVDTFA